MYSKEEIRHIAEGLIEELREMPDGTAITSAQLLMKYDYDLEQFGEWGLFDFHYALDRVARANHIKLDMSAHEGKVEGLLYNLDFIVRNKRAQIKCPYCGSKNTARILYGMPAFSDELQEKLDAGKVVLGGCCISGIRVDGKMLDLDPARHCNDCKKDFGKPPYLVKGESAEDYREIIKSIKFTDGGYFGGTTTVTITENDHGALVHVNKFPYGEVVPEDRQITSLKWMRIKNTLYTDIYLHEWKKRFDNYNVLDGEQWELEIKLTGNRKRTYSGSNAFPSYWKELKAIFNPYMK